MKPYQVPQGMVVEHLDQNQLDQVLDIHENRINELSLTLEPISCKGNQASNSFISSIQNL